MTDLHSAIKIQTTTPTLSGWYFVSDDEQDDPDSYEPSWRMYFFNADEQRLYGFCQELGCLDQSMTVTRWQLQTLNGGPHRCRDLDCYGTWVGPKRWAGPILDPTEAAKETPHD